MTTVSTDIAKSAASIRRTDMVDPLDKRGELTNAAIPVGRPLVRFAMHSLPLSSARVCNFRGAEDVMAPWCQTSHPPPADGRWAPKSLLTQ
jgi:hypothetical protein